MTKAGRDEDGGDLGFQPAVHQRHLELTLEIRHRPQPAHDDARTDLAGEVDGESVERAYVDAGPLAEAFPDHPHPLVRAEERLLAWILEHRDHHAVEDAGRSIDDVEVTMGQGVETSRIERRDHTYLKNVSRVVP